MSMLLAIDFGTWNSSAALMVNGRVEPIKEPLKGISYTFPSSVYLTEQGDFLVGEAAENSRLRDTSRYRREFKRLLGQPQPCQIGDQSLKVEDLISEVLKKLKNEAEKTVAESITDAVITIPASYKESKRQLMQQAGQAAGFRRVILLEEPVAAATDYVNKHQELLKDGDVILIYDFGGGTFDASIIKKCGVSFQLIGAPKGLENCGGRDFDHNIYEDIKERLPSVRQQLESPEAFRQKIIIYQMCVELKHQLSEATEATIDIPVGDITGESYQLYRGAFEQMIAPFVEQTIQTCDTLLQEAGIGWRDVHQVLMVGGSCRIPYIKEALNQKLGRKPLSVSDPELAVCMGAAISIEKARVNHEDDLIKNGQSVKRKHTSVAHNDWFSNTEKNSNWF
jgi:molecular chaperone DnaK